ncbi:hypothetical protein [Anatilimnocola floriformis]|uniref:hypothetical protein n=1 Tax=Anatilimnocola floriformis TaxID=2948575 RepID=UPI0020C32734|nr:hypothetical protein [Anatilimnocola floriformis]
MRRESRTPLILAVVLLILLALYVGSYLALVVPPRALIQRRGSRHMHREQAKYHYKHQEPLAKWIFWPVERLDEQLRPVQEW